MATVAKAKEPKEAKKPEAEEKGFDELYRELYPDLQESEDTDEPGADETEDTEEAGA